jgi:glucose-6-phosphate 1-dehydrogenase
VTLVIFGGAGDLAHRKLLPALYNLDVDGVLPASCVVVGVGRRDLTDDGYRAFARDGVERFSRRPIDEARWDAFARRLYFVNVTIDGDGGLATLGARLDSLEHEPGRSADRVYYLAIPPALIVPTVRTLAEAHFVAPVDSGPYARVIVEKPIGHDLASARAINDGIAQVFDERQIFRIDHYLGKETVQNILVLRFANSFLEPIVNLRHIDHVQITVAEEEGVGTRAGYYEHAGALRDMVQNHLLQLLALIAMEPPHSLDADVVRDEKLAIIRSLRPITGADVDRFVVRGQYGAAEPGSEGPVPGYRQEAGVSPASRTETFVALQVFVDNWRWAGVPFFLRTGKRLPKRCSEIAVHLKPVPPILFNVRPGSLEPDVLIIRIQPDEGFALRTESKVPGPSVKIKPVRMEFSYKDMFGGSSPEAYERLLLDVMAGDATLFMRRDLVEASWSWITPILDHWSGPEAAPPSEYVARTWGPSAADRLIEAAGRTWDCP